MYTKRNPLDTKLTAFAAPKKRFPVFKTMSNYDTLGQVGEGTYGQVFKAKDKTSLDFVALKKLYLKEDDRGKEKNRDGFPITGIREIEILRSLEHPNIVQLKAMVSISENFSMDMYMVFEYMDHDLTGLLTNSNISYGVSQIKCLSKQLFEGLAYLHDQQIIHRDIKGANLLLNNQGYLKIADFGLARRIHLDKDSGEPWEGFEYTNRVVTLWYRSPELLLGNTYYGYEVDIWSAGCILIEFYTRVALFQGRTEIDQLENIFKRCGSPNEKNWPNVKNMPWIGLFKFPHYERTLLSEFSDPSFGLTAAFLDLFDKLLTIDPKDRPSARAALNHPYFTSEQPLACRPHELPTIEGDWHEFESKMRRKNVKIAAETSSQSRKMEKEGSPHESLQRVEDEHRDETVDSKEIDRISRGTKRSRSYSPNDTTQTKDRQKSPQFRSRSRSRERMDRHSSRRDNRDYQDNNNSWNNRRDTYHDDYKVRRDESKRFKPRDNYNDRKDDYYPQNNDYRDNRSSHYRDNRSYREKDKWDRNDNYKNENWDRFDDKKEYDDDRKNSTRTHSPSLSRPNSPNDLNFSSFYKSC